MKKNKKIKNTKKNINKSGNYKNLARNSKKILEKRSEKFFEDNLQLEGRNSILEALNNDRTIDKIFIKKGEIEGTLRVIRAKALEKGVIVKEVDRLKLDEMSRTNNHQGIIAVCPAYEYYDVEDILQKAKDKNEEPFIVILDEITDPHNLGAIIRTADAAGAHGIIIPKRRSVGLTPIVSKTSCGAIEHVFVAKVGNIAKEIDKLKKEGLWIACAHTKGTKLFQSDLKGSIAIVIGNEGDGVSRLVKEKCDYSVKIPMYGNIESLNASVAASLVMYEVVRQRNFV